MVKAYYEEIKALSLFEGIDDDKDLTWLFKCIDGKVEVFEPGSILAEKGQELYFAGVILRGEARRICYADDGSESSEDPLKTGDLLICRYDGGKSATSDVKITADSGCTVLWMRWIRLMKLCNFECSFHKKLIDSVNSLMEA